MRSSIGRRFCMPAKRNPSSFLVACLAGWLGQHHQRTIDYLTEENRVPREQLGDRRLRFMFSLSGVPLEALPGFRGFARTLGRCLYP